MFTYQPPQSHRLYGVSFIALLATLSIFVVNLPGIASIGLSSLVVAILIGITLGNTWQYPHTWTPGIQFAAKRLLRLAIILYGFRVSFQQIASVGVEALALDLFVVSFTLTIGYLIGRRWLKLDHEIALLISAGAAICGAAAVLAVEDVIKSEPHKTTIAIGTVVLFGTLSMFLYPALQHAGVFALSNNQFGLFAGASIHEVAQVLVAGTNINNEVGQIAVIVKMVRVLLLVPTLIMISIFAQRIFNNTAHKTTNITIPWFAVGFIIAITINSLHIIPTTMIAYINQIDTLLLTMAMGAIGIETQLSKIKKVGLKPLYLALLLFGWLMTSVWLLVKFI